MRHAARRAAPRRGSGGGGGGARLRWAVFADDDEFLHAEGLRALLAPLDADAPLAIVASPRAARGVHGNAIYGCEAIVRASAAQVRWCAGGGGRACEEECGGVWVCASRADLAKTCLGNREA